MPGPACPPAGNSRASGAAMARALADRELLALCTRRHPAPRRLPGQVRPGAGQSRGLPQCGPQSPAPTRRDQCRRCPAPACHVSSSRAGTHGHSSSMKRPWREVFNGVCYIVKTGAHWRMMPHDLPPWQTVYQQMRRWMGAGCFEAIVHDLRVLLRRAQQRAGQPTAPSLDSRTIQSSPEGGARRLRRSQAAQGLQGACSGGHAGPPAGAGGHARQ